MKLTDTQIWTAINALHVAAVSYATDAHANADIPRLKQGFLDQADAANALAVYLEENS